jgi:predicted site-specific integrase-resolvase
MLVPEDWHLWEEERISMQGKLLLRRRDWIDRVGITKQQLTKFVKAEVLPVVKIGGKGRAYYRPEDIERVFGVKL